MSDCPLDLIHLTHQPLNSIHTKLALSSPWGEVRPYVWWCECAVIFREYVRQVLAPRLQPCDIVIMDNLRVHYDAEPISLIEQKGASVKFLSPYTPDFNPIEKMWSKVKEKLRGIGARTQEELSEAISIALSTVSSQDAEGWFCSCHITGSHS